MCKICVDALDLYFPDADDEEIHDILWNETSYPAGDGEHVAGMIKKYKERLDRIALNMGDEDQAGNISEFGAVIDD